MAKLNPTGSGFIYSTYFGGSYDDWCYGIAADTSGNAYVTGYTTSMDFPIVNAFQTVNKDGLNGFVAKIGEAVSITVDIDIKPGSFPNTIKLKDIGSIPVAIFSTPAFDARNIDVSALKLNGSGVKIVKGKGYLSSIQDVNGDGILDLVVQFDRGDVQLNVNDTSAILTGMTTDGKSIYGTDSVRVIE